MERGLTGSFRRGGGSAACTAPLTGEGRGQECWRGDPRAGQGGAGAAGQAGPGGSSPGPGACPPPGAAARHLGPAGGGCHAAGFDAAARDWCPAAGTGVRCLLMLCPAAARSGPGRAVEIGSGTGLLTSLIAQVWPEVIAVDLSGGMLARSAAHGRVQADAARLPLADGCAAGTPHIVWAGSYSLNGASHPRCARTRLPRGRACGAPLTWRPRPAQRA